MWADNFLDSPLFDLLSKIGASLMRVLLSVHGLVVADAAMSSLRSPTAIILSTINVGISLVEKMTLFVTLIFDTNYPSYLRRE